MIVANTRLTRGQLFAVVTEMSKPHNYDRSFDLIVEGGQVRLLPVEQDDEQDERGAA